MAKKNPMTVSKAGRSEGSDNKSIIDVITVKAKKDAYVLALKGNDQITVTNGNSHGIYGGAGNDKITVKKGSYHTIYGDSYGDKDKGKDKIYIKTAGRNVTVYGGKGNDQIVISKGKEHSIYAGAGNDKITIQKGAGSDICVEGNAGNDKIWVKGGNKQGIRGGTGKDKIYFSYGQFSFLDGGEANDYIEVKGSNVKSGSAIEYEKTTMGNVYIGADSVISGGDGKDKIVVKAKSNYYIHGDDSNDTIKVTGGSGHYIYGDNTGYAKGDDTITLTNVSKSYINAGDGNDTITLNSGDNNTILSGWGSSDTIIVRGGTGNTINYNDDANTTIISGGSGKVYGNGISKLYVDWAKPTAIGQFSIGEMQNNDTLYFKNTTKAALGKGNFSFDSYYGQLTIDFDKTANGIGELVINGWSKDNASNCAFKGTIYFVDKNNKVTGSLSYNEIKGFLI